MNKNEVYDFLASEGIRFERIEHPPVFHMCEDYGAMLPHPDADAKNLFVRDDKKREFFLITVRGDKRVDLKAFRREHGLRPLSFGSPEALWEKLKLRPGSVSPFGLFADETREVKFFLDEDFFKEPQLIGCHPNDNTATVFVKTEDLLGLIKKRGTTAEVVKIPVKG